VYTTRSRVDAFGGPLGGLTRRSSSAAFNQKRQR
jgi:hypothetical protein